MYLRECSEGLSSWGKAALAEHEKVDKIAFTASTNTGRAIMRSDASNLKDITLDCGGKSPLIVSEDVNLDNAVQWAHSGIMDNSTPRLYVHEEIYDAFLKAFVAYVEKNAQVGGPFEEGFTHGPRVSRAQYDKILSFIDQGRQEGAKAIIGGSKVDRKGYFIPPTGFIDADEKSTIVREEIFTPVVTISTFSSDAEAIANANDTS